MQNYFPSVLDKPLTKPKTEVALSTFLYFYSEVIQSIHKRHGNLSDMEASLMALGYSIGHRYLEYMCIRDSKPTRRDRSHVAAIQYISTVMFRALTGAPANGFERSSDTDHTYYILWEKPITDIFMSVPSDLEGFSGASLFAGIISGALGAQVLPAEVTVQLNTSDDGQDHGVVFVVSFIPLPA